MSMRTLCQTLFALVCTCGVTCAPTSYIFSEEVHKKPGVAVAEKPVEKKVELSKEELFSKDNIKKLSESLGHFIYKSLDNPFMSMEAESVVKGLQDAKAGKPSPMTEQEYEEMLQKMQEISFAEMGKKNLEQAEQFLKKNKEKKAIQNLEDGKLQIEVLAQGKGSEVVSDKDTVLIHYEGKYIDGKTFSSSHEMGEPISITLSQTIPGFKKGMVGMKIGEKRRLYVHPDLGYGTSGQLLPNALLIFDVEAVKIEPPAPEKTAPAAKDASDDDTAMDDSLDDTSEDGAVQDAADVDDQDMVDDEDLDATEPAKKK